MMFLSHVLFGFISGFFACKLLGCNNVFLFAAVASAASAIPDIDHIGSRIGRKLPPFSVIANALFSHRGFIHSVFPPLLLYFILAKTNSVIAAAALVGYTSHLLLDAATTRGIRPFAPVLKMRIRGFIRTGSSAEKIIALLMLTVAIAVVFSEIV